MGQRRKTTGELLRRHALLGFFVVAFTLTWAYWIPTALSSRALVHAAVPGFLAVVAGYGPALAALIVTWLVHGLSGLGELGRRLVEWRVGIQWYAVALFLPAAQTLAALGLYLLFGGELQVRSTAAADTIAPDGTRIWLEIASMMAMFAFGFDGLGEELGWRGFALPRLTRRFSALTASIVMGALWAVWHVPMALTAGSAMSQVPFHHQLSHMFAASILFTWIFQNTRGSILLAILFHAANNVTFNALPLFLPGAYDSGIWGDVVRWATVLAVVLVTGPRNLTQRRPPGIGLEPTESWDLERAKAQRTQAN